MKQNISWVIIVVVATVGCTSASDKSCPTATGIEGTHGLWVDVFVANGSLFFKAEAPYGVETNATVHVFRGSSSDECQAKLVWPAVSGATWAEARMVGGVNYSVPLGNASFAFIGPAGNSDYAYNVTADHWWLARNPSTGVELVPSQGPHWARLGGVG